MTEPQRCTTCGAALPFQAAACAACGTPVAPPPTQPAPPTGPYQATPPTEPYPGPVPQGAYPPPTQPGPYPEQPTSQYPPQEAWYPPGQYPGAPSASEYPGYPGYPGGPPPTPPQGPYGGPPPGPGQPKRGKGTLFAVLGTIAVLAIAAAAFFVLTSGDDDDDPEAGGGDGDELFLEAITDAGDNPWTDNADVANEDLDRLDIAIGDVPEVDEDDADDKGIPVAGDEPGLFGGVRGEVQCDKDELATQLTDDDTKAEGFAAVHDVDADDVGDFVGELTAVILRHDTRLTDHGFVGDAAESFQAVLERGTAVLVDSEGVPRVRCASGSPLAEPESVSADVKVRGTEWPGFDQDRLLVIEPADDAVDAFVLIDNDDEDVFVRTAGTAGDSDEDADADVACELNEESDTCVDGGGAGDDETTTTEPELGTGDVQFTLRWDDGSAADLDLAVTAPNGERVAFGSRTVPSGGELDTDANANCGSVDPPVENVFWPAGTAPAGAYTVEVTLFDDCDAGSQEFELTALIAGQPQVESGTLAADSETQTFSFTL